MQHVLGCAAHTYGEAQISWPQAVSDPARAASADQASSDLLWRVVEDWRGHASTPSKFMPYLEAVHAC